MVDDELLLDLAIGPDAAVYAPLQTGLMRSTDQGRNWSRQSRGRARDRRGGGR